MSSESESTQAGDRRKPIRIFGEHEPNTIAQLEDVASRAERAALMADGHQGYVMPIGGVAAYSNRVSVVGVGFDIACGNAAIRTDLTLHGTPGLVERLPAIADEIQDVVSFGMGRKNRADDAPVDHPLFASASWDALPSHARDGLRRKARAQLGTVGSGNHYVDVFVDESDVIWVGVHFGSRGFGHTVASGFLAISQGEKWGRRVPEREVLLPLDRPTGHDYWALMNLAGEYAYAGREWVARKVVSLLGARELELVHNHHNFAWREEHDGESVIVVRKGATPAFSRSDGLRRRVDGRRCRDRAGDDGPGHADGDAPARGDVLDRAWRRSSHVADTGGRQAQLAHWQGPEAWRGVTRDDGSVGAGEGSSFAVAGSTRVLTSTAGCPRCWPPSRGRSRCCTRCDR